MHSHIYTVPNMVMNQGMSHLEYRSGVQWATRVVIKKFKPREWSLRDQGVKGHWFIVSDSGTAVIVVVSHGGNIYNA